MNEEEFQKRNKMSFAQAEGRESLPERLKLKEVSPLLRALVWAIIHDGIRRDIELPSMPGGRAYVGGRWGNIMRTRHVVIELGMIDEYNDNPEIIISKVKRIIQHGDYVEFYGFIEFILKSNYRPRDFRDSIILALDKAKSAYTAIISLTYHRLGRRLLPQAETLEELEITPEMIEAGFRVLVKSGIADDYLGADKLLVEDIFRDMLAACPVLIFPQANPRGQF